MITNRLQILLASASEADCRMIKEATAPDGHTIDCVHTGAGLVVNTAGLVFDLILLDSELPGIGHVEALRMVKEAAAQKKQWLPVVLLHDSSRQSAMIESVEAGADDFIYKPLHPSVIKAKINGFAQSIASYKKLIESEALARAVSEGVVDAIISIGEDRHILSANTATERIFGYSRDELIGRNINMLMPEPYHSEHDGYVINYLTNGKPKVIGTAGREVIGQKKSGEKIYLRLGISEIAIRGQRVFIGVLSDISDLKEKEARLQRQTEHMQRLHEENQLDMDMAHYVMERMIDRQMLDQDPQISYHLRSAVKFSGDLILAVRAPNDQLYVMLADATGHGLSAAISALPALWVFYGMARKGSTVAEIATEINSRLKRSMPQGRFIAAHIASIDSARQTVRLWSGGMPSAWLICDDGQPIEFPSNHPALGIFDDRDFDADTLTIGWNNPCQLLMMSDGVSEAQCETCDMLGEQAILDIIHSRPGNRLLANLVDAVDAHLHGKPAQDDISIACIALDSHCNNPSLSADAQQVSPAY